jgi:hypothetical protein
LNENFIGRLYGVVTENIEVSTEKSAVEEVNDQGETHRESYHNIIRYGIGVWLPAYASWLDSLVLPVSKRRA